jgi:exopolysaccharide production protein ExoQ
MPPILALFLTLAFILLLFWRDMREKVEVSSALWIPLAWFFITGSRYVSQWLSMAGVKVGASSVEDGSPLDALVFAALIAYGLCILYKRRFQLSLFRDQNVWLLLFLVYCFLAIFWSDFPFVAFKRWIKVLGHPVMVLVLLTERNPEAAVRRLLKRSAYLLIPLSILLGKYYPQFGRAYNFWTGAEYYQGVMTDKNALGHVCMIVGVFFFWNALQALHNKKRKGRLSEFLLSAGFLGMTFWLLKMSSSATSVVTLVLGMLVVGVLGLPFLNRRRIGVYLIVGGLVFVAVNSMFGIYENVVHSLGRNLTLTDRTNIWETVVKLQSNPILGVGFESFWLGNRLEAFRFMLPGEAGIGEAHNGYLEIYLDLGFVGLFLFLTLLMATFYKIRLDLLKRFELGRLRMGLFVAIVAYNFTEAAFVSVHFIYAVFFLIAVDYPTVDRPRSRAVSRPVSNKSQGTLIPVGA